MKIISGVLIVLALVAVIVPIFTDCQSQGRAIELPNGKTVPMKCHWTGIASMAIGITLALLGGLIFFSKRRETQRALSILGGVLGLFLVLMPTALIGVCASSDMLCNSVMRPTLIFTGIACIVASLVALSLSMRAETTPIAGQPA